jgi:hypothetical protein
MRRISLSRGFLPVLLAVAFPFLCALGHLPGGKDEGRPKTVFYFGLPEKPIYSRSIIDSPKCRYVFTPVLQFDLVQHDFVVKNDSKRVLELKKVSACCGSLVEYYTSRIPPGGEGVIRLVLLTDRRGGQEITGTVRAQTSDPDHPVWTVEISCLVRKFADISNYTIMLEGSGREMLEGSSTIVPTDEYPFSITGLKAKKGRDILFWYRPATSREGRKAYVITVRNRRKEPGVIRDTVFVQTDNPARPEFKIRVQGRISG